MTDLTVSVRLTAKDGGLVGQLNLTEREMQNVAAAAKGAAAGGETLRASTDKVGSSMRQAANAAEQLARAERGAAAAAGGVAVSKDRLARASRDADASLRQQRASMVQVSQQLSDIQVQAIAGTNAFLILGQQGGQLAAAMANVGGRVGAVASFLAGPWGAAVIGATTLIGLFATSMRDGADATKRLEEKQFDLGKIVDETTGKLARQISVIQALAAADQRAVEFGRQRLEYQRRRTALITTGLEVGQQRTAAGERGFQIAVPTEITRSERQVASLAAAYAQGRVNAEQFSRAVDGIARSDPKIRGLATRIRQLAGATVDSAKAAENTRLEVAKIAVAAGTATEAQRRLVDSRRAAAPVNTSLIEAEVALAAATDRTSKARAELRLVELRGRDAAKAGGQAAATYREQLLAATNELNAAEAAERGAREARQSGAKATRDAARSVRELQSALEGIESRYDGVAAANRRYTEDLSEIIMLRSAGMLSQEQADRLQVEAGVRNAQEISRLQAEQLKDRLGEAGKALTEAIDRPLIDVADELKVRMADAGRSGGDAFRQSGLDAAQAIAQILGGRLGRIVGPLIGLLTGSQTGNFNTVGGRAGGILTLLSRRGSGAAVTRPTDAPIGSLEDYATRSRADLARRFGSGSGNGFAEGFQSVTGAFEKSLDKVFGRVFGERGIFPEGLSKTLGKTFGYGAAGGSVGTLVGSSTGGAVGGALGGLAGEQLFGMFGNAAGPIGSLVGGILGGVVGNLLKSTPRASATITSVDQKADVAGNNAGLRQAASGLATSVQGGLQQIAEALGGTLGSFAVSIGVRDKNLRVDPTGRGVTKTKRGAIDFGQDEGGAIAFAIADAIADGAITGLSPKVAQALGSNDNIEKAIKEALNVQELETLLGGIDAAIGQTFRDLERQIAERNRIARKYGFDLVKLEEQNAKDRTQALERVLAERTGPLQALLKDLSFGNLFEGTLAEQRDRLLGEIASAEADARSGGEGATQRVADLRRQLIEISREAFGTAGAEYASDLASSRSSAEQIIALENERVKAQAEAARATNDKLDTNNSLTNETNDLLAEQNAYLRRLANTPAQTAAQLIGGSFSRTERVSLL